MARALTRLLAVLLPAGVVVAWSVQRSRREQAALAMVATPQWPPLDTRPGTPLDTPLGTSAPNAPRWVSPVDGACPDGYPVKANDNSGIFHVPGGRFYDRTVPERCYAHADDAIADGYRAAKA